MADPTVAKSQPALAPKRAVQRCPNCDIRCDVSCFVDGALARCGHCNVRFEVRRERSAPAPTTPAATRPDPSLPALDGFAVHERIGVGGMGEVFRCTRISDGAKVAVKILTPQMAAVPDYVRRFGREAAAMSQLDHPGIVRLMGRGKAGAHVYIAMELIDGISLRTWAHKNRPTPVLIARLLAQVARSLSYAHARAVVHRDLKPDNVLVTADLRTKVLDFGLAGLHSEGAECLTQSYVSMGTANYMAPEQRKDAKRADHKADIYSFGVMAYELLTGELPVGKFPSPSKLVAGLDTGWDDLVERCLAVDPAGRPESAVELAHALESLAGMPAPPRLSSNKPQPSSRMLSWLGLGTALAVMLGVVSLRVAQDHGMQERRPQVPAARPQPKKPLRR